MEFAGVKNLYGGGVIEWTWFGLSRSSRCVCARTSVVVFHRRWDGWTCLVC